MESVKFLIAQDQSVNFVERKFQLDGPIVLVPPPFMNLNLSTKNQISGIFSFRKSGKF